MTNRYKIHIVEDDNTTRKLLENVIATLGYDCISYENGDQAWQRFQFDRPDVVISDWKVPGKDGLELCRLLRSTAKESYTYFVLVSAQKRSKPNLEAAIEAGVDDFLKKPINTEEIWNRLRVAERILNFNHQVRRLESLIPICCYCKKVRNDGDLWEQIEQYMNERTGADFTHSICPTCMETQVRPQLDSYKKSQTKAASKSLADEL